MEDERWCVRPIASCPCQKYPWHRAVYVNTCLCACVSDRKRLSACMYVYAHVINQIKKRKKNCQHQSWCPIPSPHCPSAWPQQFFASGGGATGALLSSLLDGTQVL